MGKFTTANQRGFTLIEMSIVLVIIGLIVGGILKGQELIESARQKNAISQIDGIKSGVTTFIDRFKGFPGDYSRANAALSTVLQDGDDNGYVGGAVTSTAALLTTVSDTLGTTENIQFWNHLLAANAIGGATVVASGATISSFSGQSANPSPLPAAAFPQSGLAVAFGSHSGITGSAATVREGHWLILHRFVSTGGATTSNSPISAVRTFQMDNKYDDGIPVTGNIRSLTTAAGNCGTNAGGAYGTTTAPECIPAFLLE